MLYIGYVDILNNSDNLIIDEDFSLLREKYINSINDFKRKKQSYYAWKLLAKMLKDIGFNIRNYDIIMLKNGKWVCSGNHFYFNLSHSKNIVAVSLSVDSNNAIDVEFVQERNYRIIYKNQRNISLDMSDIINSTELCTIKELEYKGNFQYKKSSLIQDELGNDYVLSFSYELNKNFNIKKYTL